MRLVNINSVDQCGSRISDIHFYFDPIFVWELLGYLSTVGLHKLWPVDHWLFVPVCCCGCVFCFLLGMIFPPQVFTSSFLLDLLNMNWLDCWRARCTHWLKSFWITVCIWGLKTLIGLLTCYFSSWWVVQNHHPSIAGCIHWLKVFLALSVCCFSLVITLSQHVCFYWNHLLTTGWSSWCGFMHILCCNRILFVKAQSVGFWYLIPVVFIHWSNLHCFCEVHWARPWYSKCLHLVLFGLH